MKRNKIFHILSPRVSFFDETCFWSGFARQLSNIIKHKDMWTPVDTCGHMWTIAYNWQHSQREQLLKGWKLV